MCICKSVFRINIFKIFYPLHQTWSFLSNILRLFIEVALSSLASWPKVDQNIMHRESKTVNLTGPYLEKDWNTGLPLSLEICSSGSRRQTFHQHSEKQLREPNILKELCDCPVGCTPQWDSQSLTWETSTYWA